MSNETHCVCPRNVSYSWYYHAQRGNHKNTKRPCSVCDTFVCRCQTTYSRTRIGFFNKDLTYDVDVDPFVCRNCKEIMEDVMTYPLAYKAPTRLFYVVRRFLVFISDTEYYFRWRFMSDSRRRLFRIQRYFEERAAQRRWKKVCAEIERQEAAKKANNKVTP